eukprot:4496841-Amphidinium_carterae.2
MLLRSSRAQQRRWRVAGNVGGHTSSWDKSPTNIGSLREFIGHEALRVVAHLVVQLLAGTRIEVQNTLDELASPHRFIAA